MLRTIKATFFLIMIIIALPAYAAKPHTSDGLVWNGNNFPSGSHFNLMIHGKKADFNCPPPEYDELSNLIFGNVINVPRDPEENISILIESGRKGPKSAPTTSELEVTDWCSVFPDHPDNEYSVGDAASFRIPKDSEGYMVFAMVTGKPTKDDGTSTQIVIRGCLEDVQDEAGNELLMLGLITTDGDSYVPECPTYSEPTTLVRTDSLKGKKVKGATNITQLFQWSGDVYSLGDVASCGTLENPCDPTEDTIVCCYEDDSDETTGVYAGCIEPALDENNYTYCPVITETNTYDVPVLVSLNSYSDTWVFNIGDFVDYLWSISNDGAYNVQVRFYPLSNQSWWDSDTDSIK
ncbi:hypothetical protein ACMXYR_01015 [Neptuniibacter sp. QD29_5]|uniref:hypothetical protein n=1 Tax=Neptuniibacter sp. QD29_5 TaxID=3398207 RepID=UPI0039F549DD